ncbi:MAG TPA: tetratricopeptide repeat protein [Caldithrix sp.]|nr:tetratricopeptide repeat protein [Caldithrix sp.]
MQNYSYSTEFIILILIVVALVIIYYFARKFRKSSKEEDNYLLALEYLVDADYKRAIQKFKEAVRENTDNIEAYLRLGNLLREKGLAKNALKIHHDLTLRSNLDADTRLKVDHSLLLDYEVQGNYQKAIEIARGLLSKENSYYKEAADKLLIYLEHLQRWNEAIETCKEYFKPYPPRIKKRLALYMAFEGEKLINQDQGKEARIKFKEALKQDPECVAAYYLLGKSYYLEERLDEAVKEWTQFCKKLPQKSHIVFNDLERAWFELGSFAEAENLYNTLLASDGENIYAALALVAIYDKKGEHDHALEILDRMEEHFPDDKRIMSSRVQILFNKGQYKVASTRALDYFREHHFLPENKYICQTCQYVSENPLWICPQCKSIDSFNI